MKPLECCGLCLEYGELEDSETSGLCHKRAEHVDSLNTMINSLNGCFDRAPYINVRVFCRVAELLPPRTSIKELCELTGVKCGDGEE